MTSRTGFADALGKSQAIAALLALRKTQPMGAKDLTLAIKGYAGRGREIGEHLQRAGLVALKRVPGIAGPDTHAWEIRLTPLGERVASALSEIEAVYLAETTNAGKLHGRGAKGGPTPSRAPRK